ncbi:bifunctional nuclease domain-containing protein [Desulfurivibrio dismutans]|uniref:bifunctional nuclease domain-containing protein n=1 Tax=Desulfurivibrio dismutans TaxID=1398908 RepID=UPI0023DBEA79|nr:bifunctional nuclease domain-containing protein [Desulfurivibrio alkaliphilus]MDF1614050.1 DUF151 domain-containing protein [Desulfurivibrio alkaliphilus]
MVFSRYLPLLFGGLVLALLALSPLPGQSRDGRELALEPDQLVEVEVATVAIADNGSPVVLLREPHANEVVPIFIGPEQALAISQALRGAAMPRPMTHDLLLNVVATLDAQLLRVYIDDLRDNTFYGMLELAVSGRDQPLHIDSRPSDALALAVRAGAGILIVPKVLQIARTIQYRGLEHEVVTALGITVNQVTKELQAALSLPDNQGVLVSNVTGPAGEAGLRPGALITEVNEQTPTNPMEFLELVRATPEGKKAAMAYWQDGQQHRLELSTEVPAPRPPRQRSSPGITLYHPAPLFQV